MECKSNITLAGWAQLEGRNFCKVCFTKIFSLRGRYDDVKEGVHVPVKGAPAAEPKEEAKEEPKAAAEPAAE
jgi:hypothetical protein